MIILSDFDSKNVQQKFDILNDSKFSGIPFPKAFTPNILSSDKIITRYFVKKTNDMLITETNQQDFYSVGTSGFYTSVSLSWQVRGIKNTIVDSNGVQDIGVSEYNRSQISKAESSMIGITKKLINPLEFYQGIN